ncbi:MAG: thioredoxin domain-containing protein, partial [Cytophagales bacterium]|nr:thioredoxin domain-containing protein [Cytophagales bacterium]
DADSEGVEGKYYVWTHEEFISVLGDWASTFSDYYQVSRHGNWEEGINILHRKSSDEEFSQMAFADVSVFKRIKEEANAKLLKHRRQRVSPGLDNKILCSWNGLMLKALCDSYQIFCRESDLQLAIRNEKFIFDNFYVDGRLLHSFKDGVAGIQGYLEDYAAVVRGLVQLYQCTFEEGYLTKAKSLIDYVLAHFYDEGEGLFYFTDKQSEPLVARKKEIMDNVIPSSNAMFVESLFILGHIMGQNRWVEMAESAVSTVAKLTAGEPYYMAHWAKVSVIMRVGLTEIALVGPDVHAIKLELFPQILPSAILCGTSTKSMLPLMQHPLPSNGQTAIYICKDFTCLAPVFSVPEAILLLENGVKLD